MKVALKGAFNWAVDNLFPDEVEEGAYKVSFNVYYHSKGVLDIADVSMKKVKE